MAQISSRRHRWPESHFTSRPKPSLHIDHLVVVLEFCLRPKNHQKELLVWVVRKLLSIGSYFMEEFLIHQIYHRSKVSRVSRKTIGCPCQNAIKLSLSYLVD